MIPASPAWNPHATLALVTTVRRALSSPRLQCPKPSPRSALRSMPSRYLLLHQRLQKRLRLGERGEMRRAGDQLDGLARRLDALEVLLRQLGDGQNIALALEKAERNLEYRPVGVRVVGRVFGVHLLLHAHESG